MAGEVLAGPALKDRAIDRAEFFGWRLGVAGGPRRTDEGAGGNRDNPAAVGTLSAWGRGRAIHFQTTAARAEEADVTIARDIGRQRGRLHANANASATLRANDPLGRIDRNRQGLAASAGRASHRSEVLEREVEKGRVESRFKNIGFSCRDSRLRAGPLALESRIGFLESDSPFRQHEAVNRNHGVHAA